MSTQPLPGVLSSCRARRGGGTPREAEAAFPELDSLGGSGPQGAAAWTQEEGVLAGGGHADEGPREQAVLVRDTEETLIGAY